MAKSKYSSKVEFNTLEKLKTENVKEEENKSGLMAHFMMVNGKMTWPMGKEYFTSKKEAIIKETLKMINSMDMASSSLLIKT